MNLAKAQQNFIQDKIKYYPYPVEKEKITDDDFREILLNELIEEYDSKL